MTEGIITGMPEGEYHAHPALSSTGARLLLESPAKFRYRQDHPQPHKDAFDLGTAVHSKVLGTGAATTIIPEEILASNGSASTKAAKDFIEDARLLGLIPIRKSTADEVDAMAESVLSHPTARALFEQRGAAETSVFATDPTTGVDVRARFDYLPNLDGSQIAAIDLKTTGKSASKGEFEKSVANFGYHIQQAHYTHALELAAGESVPFVFVVVETEAPHLVAVHQLDRFWAEMGYTAAKAARELFADCTSNNKWPGYDTAVQLITPPTWSVYQHEERFAS